MHGLYPCELSRYVAVPKIDIHPQALKGYGAAMANLADNLDATREDSSEAFVGAQRLIGRVIVHPGPPVTVEVVGRIMALTGQVKQVQNGHVVNGGSERGTRTPDPRIMIPVL
jgi:site-specific DNA recombinase